MKLWVGNLHWKTDETKLGSVFDHFKATVMFCKIARDSEGVSLRWAFVTIDPYHIEKALRADGFMVDGNKIKVKKAGQRIDGKPKTKRPAAATSGNLFD